MSAMFPNDLEFGRQFGITDLIRVKVGNVYPHPVFHFEGADIVEERSPALELFQVLGYVMGEKDVAGVATIHHPLGHVDAASGHIGPLVHVHHTADRAAVNPHADGQTRVVLERAADLKRALGRFLRTLVKDQRHAVAGRDLYYAVGCFGFTELFGQANHFIQLTNPGVLLVS
jgi:hypothetical protein